MHKALFSFKIIVGIFSIHSGLKWSISAYSRIDLDRPAESILRSLIIEEEFSRNDNAEL